MSPSREFERLVQFYLPGTTVQTVTTDRHNPDAIVRAAWIRYDLWETCNVAQLAKLHERIVKNYPKATITLEVEAPHGNAPDVVEWRLALRVLLGDQRP